jgi:hypothetical protein
MKGFVRSLDVDWIACRTVKHKLVISDRRFDPFPSKDFTLFHGKAREFMIGTSIEKVKNMSRQSGHDSVFSFHEGETLI